MAVDKQNPPAELVAQCEELNKQWLSSLLCTAVPYFHCGEFDDEWRIEIIASRLHNQAETYTLCKYICPEKADGHLLYLLARACFDAEDRGKEAGKTEALLNLFQNQCIAAGIGNGLVSVSIERNINGVVSNATLAKNK